MAAIRLAFSVRDSMNAPKAGVDSEKAAVKADSYGLHHPNLLPPSSVNPTTPGERGPFQILDQTASAPSASNSTRPGFANARNRYPSPSLSDRTGILPQRTSAPAADLTILANTPAVATSEALKRHQGYFPPPDPPMSNGDGPGIEDVAADTPTGVKREALVQHHGYFPPPEPPIDSTQDGGRIHPRLSPPPGKSASDGIGPIAIKVNTDNMLVPDSGNHVSPPVGATAAPPGESVSKRTGPIPIRPQAGPVDIGLYQPGDTPPQCQLYVTNTGINNTFAVCPVTKRATDPTRNLAIRQFHTGKFSIPHILAIRDTATCEAPTSFNQRVACGQFDGWFAFAFFLLFGTICAAWIRRRYNGRQHDEETGTATWPRRSYFSIDSSKAKPKLQTSKVSTNSAEAKLRQKIRQKGHEGNRRLDGELGTDQYESVAWRSAIHRATRAHNEGRCKHDAGPVAVLPQIFVEVPVYHSVEPSAFS